MSDKRYSRALMAAAVLAAGVLVQVVSPGKVAHARSLQSQRTVLVKETNNRYFYTPAKITIKVGTKVVWTNKTDAAHNVTLNSGPKYNQDFKPAKNVSHVFSKTGKFAYHCEYHPYMKGTVTVTK